MVSRSVVATSWSVTMSSWMVSARRRNVMPGWFMRSLIPCTRPAPLNAILRSSRRRSWMVVASSRISSMGTDCTSSMVMSTPSTARSRSRSMVLRVGSGLVAGSTAMLTLPRPAMVMPVILRLLFDAGSVTARGMTVCMRWWIMSCRGSARSTIHPYCAAMSSNSLRSTVFPMPRGPHTREARMGLPGSKSPRWNERIHSSRPAR